MKLISKLLKTLSSQKWSNLQAIKMRKKFLILRRINLIQEINLIYEQPLKFFICFYLYLKYII